MYYYPQVFWNSYMYSIGHRYLQARQRNPYPYTYQWPVRMPAGFQMNMPMRMPTVLPAPSVQLQSRVTAQTTEGKKAADAAAVDLRPDSFTAAGLGQSDLEEIVSKFGVEIEDIYNLAPGQEWMFSKTHKVTNAFFLQDYLKVSMKLKPSTFRQRVDAMSIKRSNLRTAFAYRNQDKVYQVVLKNRRPELRFINRSDMTLEELEAEIERYREADRRRGFDLERDPLMRITVFSTADEDTYAMIVSQPHINHDGGSMMTIYKELLIDYVFDGKGPVPELAAGSYRDYAKFLQSIDKEKELGYWEELLKGSTPTRLPGRVMSGLESLMNALELRLEGSQGAAAGFLPGRYKATMNCIVQSAWGIMLQKLYGMQEAVFGTITSGRSAEVRNSDTMTGGFVNAFPVRISAEPSECFAEVVKRTQLQMASSIQMAHCSPNEISERLGCDDLIFDHLLNFHNFADTSAGVPAMPGLTILGADVFDNLSTGFCLYIQQPKDGLKLIFSYDQRSFTERKIRILADCFFQVFQQILEDAEGTLKIDEIKCPDLSVFISTGRDEEEERAKLESFLRSVSIFAGVEDSGISAISQQTEVISYAEGDDIFRERQIVSGIHIVIEGRVNVTRSSIHGWDNPLHILKAGHIISAAGVLEEGISFCTAQAASRQVRIAYIPRETMQGFMKAYPVIAENLISEQEKLLRTFSFLWINAE